MKYLYPLNARHNTGRVILLYSIDDVHAFIKQYGRFHDHYGRWFPYLWSTRFEIHDWIVRDDCGRIVKYDDVAPPVGSYRYGEHRRKLIRQYAENGLAIPYTGTSRPWKMNHTAKKNSGKGHRNRNRAKCEYERIEYQIPNKYGKVRPWEGC